MTKIVTVVGARPQFIKAAAISRAIRRHNADSGAPIREVLVHTGQHFDRNMSEAFFGELDLPEPDFNLEIAGLPHGAMTGRMLERLESVLQEEVPDLVLIYGDTNSTRAGALAASKLHIPVAHVEAGLRSFNMRMPEEINRVLADRVSTYLLCPTTQAVDNLHQEGVTNGVHLVGDVMYDVTLYYRGKAASNIDLGRWGVQPGAYVLATIHRAENTDDTERLAAIFSALGEIARECPVVLPLHPRTRNLIRNLGKEDWLRNLTVLEPVSYLEMLRLEMSARAIVTDSGGVQKEAFFHGVPCITVRDETEWVETVELGWNELVGADLARILAAFTDRKERSRRDTEHPYGDGDAAGKILDVLVAGS
jgi:UDP-GlcNAc3NAcA epimerase